MVEKKEEKKEDKNKNTHLHNTINRTFHCFSLSGSHEANLTWGKGHQP